MINFWDVNFWGILGLIVASFSLFVSYLIFKYSKPKIRITALTLNARKFDYEYMEKNAQSTDQSFKKHFSNHSTRFSLDIRLANKKGGAGALSKPLLIIKVGPKYLFKKRDEIIIDPKTKEYKHSQISISGSMAHYETETIDLGGSFNLSGGQIIYAEIEYSLGDEGMFKLAQNIKNAEYCVRYNTNSGKEKEIPVKLSLTEH